MATVNDMILEELRNLRADSIYMREKMDKEAEYMRGKLDYLGKDVAVLKAKHDTGNLSEKIVACGAVIAMLISLFAIVKSFSPQKRNISFERTYKNRDASINSSSNLRNIMSGHIQPSKKTLPV